MLDVLFGDLFGAEHHLPVRKAGFRRSPQIQDDLQ
jgi:hypothetical protein